MPRAYAAVASYLKAVGYEFDEQTFEQYFTAIQEIVAFEMRELWQLQPFAKMALLESVAGRRLGSMWRRRVAPVAPAEESKTARGSSGRKGGERLRSAPALMSTLIVSMRRIDGADWNELFERVNAVEQILRRDPCDAYASMDFESRDNYRKRSRNWRSVRKQASRRWREKTWSWRARFMLPECARARASVARRLLPGGRRPESSWRKRSHTVRRWRSEPSGS